MILAIIVAVACFYGYYKATKQTVIFIGPVVFILFMFIELMSYGLGLGKMGAFSIQNNASQFVEFHETGIRFMNHHKLHERIYDLWQILRNKDVCEYVDYEDIEEVIIEPKKSYMKIPASQLSTQ